MLAAVCSSELLVTKGIAILHIAYHYSLQSTVTEKEKRTALSGSTRTSTWLVAVTHITDPWIGPSLLSKLSCGTAGCNFELHNEEVQYCRCETSNRNRTFRSWFILPLYIGSPCFPFVQVWINALLKKDFDIPDKKHLCRFLYSFQCESCVKIVTKTSASHVQR